MSKLLNDALNLKILQSICAGDSVKVNINALSQMLDKHRNTIKDRVDALFAHEIVTRPFYPFYYLYKEYPLLVVARSDLPRTQEIDSFLKEDEHIFAAFYVKDEEYNTLMVEYHKDIYAYGEWRKGLIAKKKIPSREYRIPADALFFSTKHFIKYQPASALELFEKKYQQEETVDINGYKMDRLCFDILKKLMRGEGIRTNETAIANKIGVNRKTVERRIGALLQEKIVLDPLCRFPRFFAPSNQVLVYYLVEIKKSRDKIIESVVADPHIPFAVEESTGRYSLLLFEVFFNVEEHLEWEELYNKRFPDSLGAMKNIYLSPKMTAAVNQQKIALDIINNKKKLLRGGELMENMTLS
ncbi:MAG: hypothetical protein PHZ19_00170 [Candidatus Thermoplasmatota archaeon]|nr:hypothetical protein [Candidatus Thermoplasmatota archaeon]